MIEGILLFWVKRLPNCDSTQYRSAIFTYSPEQKHIARQILDEVQEKHFKGKKIVVCVQPEAEFNVVKD
jgi:peptide methionine sulfoxide reductase MsrA